MIVLPSFHLAIPLNSQNTNETEIINELCHINLFINIGISNWHNWIFDVNDFFDLFHFLTWLLNSKHLKHFSTYLVGRNVKMWITCFSAPQNAKKKISWNIKTKCVTDYLSTNLRVWRIILVITRWAHKR